MKKIKVLNLYAGIGGNRKLWENVDVTAVEMNAEIAKIYQDFFPDDKVIVGDAHEYLLKHYKEFDFIWSSPPCQTNSRLNKFTRHQLDRYPDLTLYQQYIFLTHHYNCKFVIENVIPYYHPLIEPQISDRHCFWSNFHITNLKIDKPKRFMRLKKEQLMSFLGINLKENIYLDGNHDECQILRNCVHPKLGLHIFNAAFKTKQTLLGDVHK